MEDLEKADLKILYFINKKYLLELKIKKYTEELEDLHEYINNFKNIKSLNKINNIFIKKYKEIITEDSDSDNNDDNKIKI